MKRRNDLTACAFYRGLAGVLVFPLPPRGLDLTSSALVGESWVFFVCSVSYCLFAFFPCSGFGNGARVGLRLFFLLVFDSPVYRFNGSLFFFWVASSMYILWIRGTVGVFETLVGLCGLASVFILYPFYTAIVWGDLGSGERPCMGIQFAA